MAPALIWTIYHQDRLSSWDPLPTKGGVELDRLFRAKVIVSYLCPSSFCFRALTSCPESDNASNPGPLLLLVFLKQHL